MFTGSTMQKLTSEVHRGYATAICENSLQVPFFRMLIRATALTHERRNGTKLVAKKETWKKHERVFLNLLVGVLGSTAIYCVEGSRSLKCKYITCFSFIYIYI